MIATFKKEIKYLKVTPNENCKLFYFFLLIKHFNFVLDLNTKNNF